jgi:nucleosome binding factor SPN SPT16 subunit
MEEIRQEIIKHGTIDRWAALDSQWGAFFGGVDAILIRDGLDEEDVIKLKTTALQSWLFRFEFINSIVVLSKTHILIFSNKEKLELFSHLVESARQNGRECLLIEKNDKTLETDVASFVSAIERLNLKKLGVFSREKQKGKVIDLFDEQVAKRAFVESDVSIAVQEFLSCKNQDDIAAIKKCAQANVLLFQKLIAAIEKILDQGSKETHSGIARSMENSLPVWKREIEKKFGVKSSFFDYTYSPVIQSGSEFDLRPDAENNDKALCQNYILLNMACKYFELNTNIFRSILINPNDEDKANYSALLDIHKTVISSLKAGSRISDAFSHIVGHAKEKFPHLADSLPSNFGFGIGYEFREGCLAITAKNEREIKVGHVFTVITSLKGLKGRNNVQYSLHLSDTLIINADNRAEVLTDEISKRLDDIGYALEDEEEDIKENKNHKNKQESKAESKPRTAMEIEEDNMVARTRAAKRNQQLVLEQEKNAKIKEHQKELLDQKMAELEDRLKSGNFIFKQSENSKIILEKLKTYTPESFPKTLSTKNIHIDHKNNAVLLPINGRLVPFHVSCFKNATKHTENKMSTLRFNFQTPGISTGNIIFPAPNTFGSHPIYIKELMFKSANGENYNAIVKDIKEMQKKLKSSSTVPKEKEGEKTQFQNKLKTLNELKIRPTLAGRKTVGSLTAYTNGFRFLSKRNETLDIPLSNIKHAIFQPCEENMIIIIHFVLHNPITINKKPHHHIQFYSEVGYTSEDLNDPKKKNRMNDWDELEEEELEKQARDHYNKLFLDYVSYVEKNWTSDLKFDSPYPDYGFYGSPTYNNVFIMPTAYCIVSLIETPFLVITLDEIELVSLERVDNKIKNFDMVFIFKDYNRTVQTISNIPKTNLDTIKKWLEYSKKP